MGLSNAAKRARLYDSTINQNQGGGNKKAGFPYMIGREWQTSIAFNNTNVANNHCFKLNSFATTCPAAANVKQSRPIGGDVKNTYWSR